MPAWQRGAIGVGVFLILAQMMGVTDGLNRWLTDTHWRYCAYLKATSFPSDILVVAIDDKTITKFGRLRYWSRGQYASLLSRLSLAKAVGLDILFTEADKLDTRGDVALAHALRENGRTVLACFEWTEARPVSSGDLSRLAESLSLLPKFARPAPTLPRIFSHSVEPPILPLLRSARSVGLASVNADSDGVYRTPVILKTTKEGLILPHISLAVACIARGLSLPDAVGDGSVLNLGERTIPISDGAISLRPISTRGGSYTGSGGARVPTVSFVDALTMSPEKFKGKIVLVGETATGTADIRPNPLDNGLRGVELNAEILANLLYLRPVRPMPIGLSWLLIAFGVALPVWLFQSFNPARASFGALAAFVVVFGIMEIAFWGLGWIPSWSGVLLAFVGSVLAMIGQRYAQEEALKRRLRRSFSVYVSPQLVDAIVANPQIAEQEGSRRRVAVLFSDIRQFTPYCEHHSPEFVVRQMREYLDEMTAAVDNCDGVLDKYIGDAVMALFGPFLPDSCNISAKAVLCALEMLDRLEALNKRWQISEMPTFRIGIGINEGDAIVGNIGARRRMQFTALGDTVNLASRLENTAKDFAISLVVSEGVKNEAEKDLSDGIVFISRGLANVAGREQPVPVYEVRRKVNVEEGICCGIQEANSIGERSH